MKLLYKFQLKRGFGCVMKIVDMLTQPIRRLKRPSWLNFENCCCTIILCFINYTAKHFYYDLRKYSQINIWFLFTIYTLIGLNFKNNFNTCCVKTYVLQSNYTKFQKNPTNKYFFLLPLLTPLEVDFQKIWY